MSVSLKMENKQSSSNETNETRSNDFDDTDFTIRIRFTSKEVGNVIGKRGETIQNIRQQSDAKVLISNSSTIERIVYITGNRNAICKAIELIGLKVEEFLDRIYYGDCKSQKAPLTLNIIMPASKCGSIIGKNGSKIKEIRESCRAAIQVGKDMLPNSTDRLVSITGTIDAISHCVYLVCGALRESPPRTASTPYHPPSEIAGFATYPVVKDLSSEHNIPSSNLAALGLGTASNGGINPTALSALARSQLRASNRLIRNVGEKHNDQNSNSDIETVKITVPNDLIGCVIGIRGTNISEIRNLSGAIVHIHKSEGTEKWENVDRHITITGNKESISVAMNLIEMSMVLQKAKHKDVGSSSSTENQLFAKPYRITSVSSLCAYIGLSGEKRSPPIQTTGVHRPNNYLKRKRSPSSERTKAERTKFAHY